MSDFLKTVTDPITYEWSHVLRGDRQSVTLTTRNTKGLWRQRMDVYRDLKNHPPLERSSQIAEQINNRIATGDDQTSRWENTIADLNAINFLMNEERVGMVGLAPGRENQSWRQTRVVDMLRVLEGKMFGSSGAPNSENEWAAHFGKILSFLDPTALSPKPMDNDRNHVVRWLRSWALGYLLEWYKVDNGKFLHEDDEQTIPFKGLVAAFKQLAPREREDVFVRLLTFDKKAKLGSSTSLLWGLTPLGAPDEDHQLFTSLGKMSPMGV